MGKFPLCTVNRLFSNFAGTDGRVEHLLREFGVVAGCSEVTSEEIDSADLIRLLRRTVRLARDETWNLRPSPTKIGTFAQACCIAVHGGTVERGLKAAFHYYHSLADDFTLRLGHSGEHSSITLSDALPDRLARDVMHVLCLHFTFALIGWLSGQDGFVEQIFLYHSLPPNGEGLEAAFKAKVVGNAPVTRMIVDWEALKRPIQAQPSQIQAFISNVFSRMTLLLDGVRSVGERVAGCFAAQGHWDVRREVAAAALGMSEATFNRRLHEETGLGFQAFKDQLRYAAALELMMLNGMPLERVAHTLGFSELSSFHRAFRRWTDQAPGGYRAALLPRCPSKASRAPSRAKAVRYRVDTDRFGHIL